MVCKSTIYTTGVPFGIPEELIGAIINYVALLSKIDKVYVTVCIQINSYA